MTNDEDKNMANEIRPLTPTDVAVGNPSGNNPLFFTQTGDNGTQIGHADTVKLNVNMNIEAGTLSPDGKIVRTSNSLSREYYNLFVIGAGIQFDSLEGSFLMMSQRAFEYTDKDIRDRLLYLTEENREEIKSFPSLFLAENEEYGKAGSSQVAYLGRVLEIRPHGDKNIKVKYRFQKDIPQQRLNELLDELCLGGAKCFNELNRTHWAVKRVDLLDELASAKIDLF